SNSIEDCDVLQINSTENYVRYHLVSMMEKIKASKDPKPLKVVLLGCTHYPYLEKEMKAVIKELYEYQDEDGYRYKHLISSNIEIVDPALNVAEELFQFLNENDLLNPNGQVSDSEFYISVPNIQNTNVVTEGNQNFTYDYKYGRSAGDIQEYVKIVPFSRKNISDDTFDRLQESVPTVYQTIVDFHIGNKKLKNLPKDSLIK
ncbi:Asp/Glu/hydantoin racemase, partial [Belliella sp. R4-6]|nr:Asp/Glu/hydantoin racemase [Belliella alkalica]